MTESNPGREPVPVRRTIPVGAAFPAGANVTLDDLRGDAHPVLKMLRETEPVSWLPAINGWLVTGRDEALTAMTDAELFTVDDPRFSTAQVVGPSMLSLDGAEHARHREPFVAPFRRGVVDRELTPWTNAAAQAIVDGFQAHGEAELRTQLAAPLAAQVITHALGLHETSVDEVLGWYRGIVDSVSAITSGLEPSDAGADAFEDLRVAVARTVAQAHDSLLARVANSDALSLRELASNAAVLMFGAIETSESMTANAFHHILTAAGMVDRLCSEPGLVANVVEESLRLEPAAAVVDRYATAEVDLGSARVRRGDYVSISLAGANRDPLMFVDPDAFDPDRPNLRQHLAFVRGPHACLGAHLARVETVAAINAVLTAMPALEYAADASAPPTGLVFRKAAAVVVRW